MLATSLFVSLVALSAQPKHRIQTDNGDIIITPIIHSSVQVEHAGTVIHVDPWSVGDLSQAKAADLILVTDDPGHHLDPVAIERLRKPNTSIVLTASAYERFSDGHVLENGESRVFSGVPVEAVPAYDMTPGAPLHPKGEANGYIVTLAGKRIFFSGVGECVPEIQALRDITVAFMPMNLPVDRMRPTPVAECVKTFMPKVVYLNHYDQPHARWLSNQQEPFPHGVQDTATTINNFIDALQGDSIEFRSGDWYPPPPPMATR